MSLQVDIKKKLKGFTLDVTFEADGDCMGILGASGCGKSMTLKCIAGIEKPDSGRIVLNGKILFDSEKHINLSTQKRKVGYLFQNYALFPNMTVRENISVGLAASKENSNSRLEELAALFQLEGLENRYPWQLSGGQQQRVALARSLAYEPEVLMLDEPFSALDEYLKENLQIQVKEILNRYKGDILMVTHSREEVYRFCPKIAVVHNGHVVARGDTREIFQNPCHVTAAKLSGCKNISRIKRTGENRVYALDWNTELVTAESVGDEVRYIGIRAHDLQPVYDETYQENLISCLHPELPEGLFEQVVLFRTAEQSDSLLWWKVGKEQWREAFVQKLPEQFYLPPEALMLLTEE